jgi:hypothetical protein
LDLEKEINSILFKIGKDIKIHKIDNNNSVIELDYQKYTTEILELFQKYLDAS